MQKIVWLCSLGVCSLGSVSSTTAYADAISPPPAVCPEGSGAFECHGPETCRLDSCTVDEDCPEEHTCEARSLCVRPHCCNGQLGCEPGGSVEHVLGMCTAGSCAEGACEERNVCVASEPAEPDAGRGGGGTDGGCCSAIGARSEAGGALCLAMVVLGLLYRRRAR